MRFLQDEDIRNDSNLEFVNRIFDALPPAERKGLTTNGKINDEGYQRIERALLAKAFHSSEHPEFLKTMIQNSASDFKQIANALKNTARRWVYMKAKMKAGVFINQDPTSHLLEAINEFKNLKSGLRRKAAEKFTEEDIQRGVSEKLLGKSKGFRYVLREHVNVLRDQMNLDPTIGTHANTVLFLDFLSVADSQEKIELGLRSFIDELEAYPADQPSIFEQPTMEAILDRTIGAHRTNLKVDVQRMETPQRPPETITEEVTQNQVYAQDEEIDFKAREEEEVIEDIPEQGPTDAELDTLEAQIDAELANDPTWNAEKELADIRELEKVGDAMADDSPMMNCILGKI
jgi:hypothetical protein